MLSTPSDASLGSIGSRANPEEPLTSEGLSRADRAHYLTRARRKHRANEWEMGVDRPAISPRVLHHQDQPNRTVMPGGKLIALRRSGAVLRLSVREDALDLDYQTPTRTTGTPTV